VWSWFCRLNATRTSGGFGFSAITYLEMQAFFSMEGISLNGWELDFIRAFDKVAMEHFAEEQKKQESKK
jgi:hypothetical protein